MRFLKIIHIDGRGLFPSSTDYRPETTINAKACYTNFKKINIIIEASQLPRGLKPRGLSREAQRKS